MKYILAMAMFVFSISSACAEGSDTTEGDAASINVILGLSPFIGLLGLEVQKGHHALAIGLPGRIAYRYYANPNDDGIFAGVYVGQFSLDNYNKSVDGVVYQNMKTSHAGIGFGHQWLWASGWNVNLSIALEFASQRYSNPGQTEKKKRVIYPFPGLNVGYKF